MTRRRASLAAADALTLHPWVPGAEGGGVQWRLLGTLSNARYATRDEVDGLRRRHEDLDRPKATLIPIRPTQPADLLQPEDVTAEPITIAGRRTMARRREVGHGGSSSGRRGIAPR